MLSRVAENLYWFGRHLERAENTARLISAYTDLVLDLPQRSTVDWYSLVEITGSEAAFTELGIRNTEPGIMAFLMDDERNPGSIRQSIVRGRENLRIFRDRIPREMSETIMSLLDFARSEGPNCIRRSAARSSYLRGLVDRCQTLRGYMGGSMSRGADYRFIRFGRMLERADMTTRIMDVRFDDLVPEQAETLPSFDAVQWMSVLRSLSAYQMYRRKLRGRVRGLDVIEFLFLDENFPRSVLYSLMSGRGSVTALPNSEVPVAACTALIDKVRQIKATAMARDSATLRKTIDGIQQEINAIHRIFSQHYFAIPTLPAAE